VVVVCGDVVDIWPQSLTQGGFFNPHRLRGCAANTPLLTRQIGRLSTGDGCAKGGRAIWHAT